MPHNGLMFPASAAAPALTVLTQNIRMASPSTAPGDPDHWEDRRHALAQLLTDSAADVVATQEVLAGQIPVLHSVLGQTHLQLGFGREGGGRGEHNLLFLRRDRFEVLDWFQFWLSQQPLLMGSTGWDAACPRIAVLATVRDRVTDETLTLVNTHLDHVSEDARVQGARVILEQIGAISEAGPVVITGDFNAAAGSSETWQLFQQAGFQDCHDGAGEHLGEDIGTFPDYEDPVVGADRIDWILTRGVETDTYSAQAYRHDGAWASDHAAVAVTLHC